jgi:urea transport system ATP-binding protein
MSKPQEFILTVEDVNKSFEGFKAISDLNFYMDKGELRTIIGPNGAGKSTFLDLITGKIKTDTGKILFGNEDHDLTKLREYQINRLGIARKFQTPSVYEDHTVFDNVMLSLPESRGVFSSIFFRLDSEATDRIEEILKTIRLKDMETVIAGALSHGQKQWLEIGMLLAQQPKLLLVDEPAAGMSDDETKRTGELLLSLEKKHSIIVIEHDMEFVRQIARKVTVLHQGKVIKEGSMDSIQSDPTVAEVYLGRKHSTAT